MAIPNGFEEVPADEMETLFILAVVNMRRSEGARGLGDNGQGWEMPPVRRSQIHNDPDYGWSIEIDWYKGNEGYSGEFWNEVFKICKRENYGFKRVSVSQGRQNDRAFFAAGFVFWR